VWSLNEEQQRKLPKQHSEPAMSHTISTLLMRNLQDVFGENDAARRRAAINEIFTEDCVFYEPNGGVYRGRNEIDHIAGTIRDTYADFRYQPIAEPEELGDAGRIRWVEGRPDEAPTLAGIALSTAQLIWLTDAAETRSVSVIAFLKCAMSMLSSPPRVAGRLCWSSMTSKI
jgi:hypothetical protein